MILPNTTNTTGSALPRWSARRLMPLPVAIPDDCGSRDWTRPVCCPCCGERLNGEARCGECGQEVR